MATSTTDSPQYPDIETKLCENISSLLHCNYPLRFRTVFAMHPWFSLFSRSKWGPLRPISRVYDLKQRLDWGEPALTIIDIRDRQDFQEMHVSGSVSIPYPSLLTTVLRCFEWNRDLYIYGNTDNEAEVAADQLRAAGYSRVSILRGGVAAWKAASFPIEVSLPALADLT
jgi:rhodanese-related sulfurtransferase